jgi:hypothetical protein
MDPPFEEVKEGCPPVFRASDNQAEASLSALPMSWWADSGLEGGMPCHSKVSAVRHVVALGASVGRPSGAVDSCLLYFAGHAGRLGMVPASVLVPSRLRVVTASTHS